MKEKKAATVTEVRKSWNKILNKKCWSIQIPFPKNFIPWDFVVSFTTPNPTHFSWADSTMQIVVCWLSVGRLTTCWVQLVHFLHEIIFFLFLETKISIFPFSVLAIQRVTTAAHQMVLSRTTNVDDNDEILKTHWFLLLRLSTWSYTTSYWCCVFCEHSFVASLTVKFYADEDYKVMENREKMIEKGVLNARWEKKKKNDEKSQII